MPNRLISETSPYLLQHAHNPVDWFPWGEEALQKAQREDKPIIVSIGYSACHWCHVMERECFENKQIAALMNEKYVCIKVDREERPDIDHLHMDAVQAMGLNGGWPLNVILTPYGKPFYGGTYFPPTSWIQVLEGIYKVFTEEREKIEVSAQSFVDSLNHSIFKKYGIGQPYAEFKLKQEHYEQMFLQMARTFDKTNGGNQRAPKFPMPAFWLFLLRYYKLFNNKEVYDQVNLTLKKMALGGIYDQIGGGFARYSTDLEWFVPHFEKMLYDNGQLVMLYTEAYQLSHEPLYKETVYQTIAFVQRELTSEEGGFYSALDADSEGEEGKFYIWKYEEIEKLDLPQKQWFILYYNIRPEGTWEEENNIFFREHTRQEFCTEHELNEEEFTIWEKQWQQVLLSEREKRIRPGLDDKVLASWNGLMLNGLVEAYRIFDEDRFLQLALKNAAFIENKLIENKKLKHSYKNGKAKIEGYLEDYASVILAFTNLYQATFDEKWLKLALQLTETTFTLFWDEKETLFFFTSADSEQLIATKKEILDNVIPSSNSYMANNLLMLGHLLAKNEWVETAIKMVSVMQGMLVKEPYFFSNWGIASLLIYTPLYEIAIVGPEAETFRKELDKIHFPNKILVGSRWETNSLELLKDRAPIQGKTAIYVCLNKACQLPVFTVQEALALLIS